jgi:hypothetical protein
MMEPSRGAASVASNAEPLPTGVRIASTLCWLAGILTALVAVAVNGPAVSGAKPGNFLLFAAMIALALNWKHLR